MNLKKILILCMAVVMVISMSSCKGKKEINKISDLAYDYSGSIHQIYITENGKYIPFLVLTNDYCGNTLLLREEIIDENRRISEYSAYYADSEIDSYLNKEYLEALTEIAQYVTISNVEITCDDALGMSGLDTEVILRRVFLLSCNEVGISDSVNIATEGEILEYFQNENYRNAYYCENPSSWWLRTPNTYYLSCTYVIGENNKLGFSNAFDQNGIRPAFCVDGDMRVKLENGIVDDKKVYVFLLED